MTQEIRQVRLRIEAAGLCCSVGYSLPAAACAIRANMDHFQESQFMTSIGEPILVGRLPDLDVWGSARLARWAAAAIDDCMRDTAVDLTQVPIVLMLPEETRPTLDVGDGVEFVNALEVELDTSFHDLYQITRLGRAGFVDALEAAQRLLSPDVTRVLLVGVDSYLNAASIEHYRSANRLLHASNRNGFIPSEAAAAVLLTLAEDSDGGVIIEGVGKAHEQGRPDGSEPSRAQGLTHAVRHACEQASIHPHQLRFRLSDKNGEVFFAREAAHAFTRLMFEGPDLQHLTLAESLGEVGAAMGPAALAYLSSEMVRPNTSIGQQGVIHLANDDGLRNAVVLRHRSDQSI